MQQTLKFSCSYLNDFLKTKNSAKWWKFFTVLEKKPFKIQLIGDGINTHLASLLDQKIKNTTYVVDGGMDFIADKVLLL